MLGCFTAVLYFMLIGFIFSENWCDESSEECSVFAHQRSQRNNNDLAAEEIEEMKKLDICFSEFEDKGFQESSFLCSVRKENGTNSSEMFNWASLKNTSCFCDLKCHNYHDCCLDYAEMKDIFNAKPLSCRRLPNTSVYVYTVQKCSPEWENDFTRLLCEEEPLDLQTSGRYFSHLQYIPVHSTKTNVIYRNIYCAVCNNDISLTKWKTHVHCSGHSEHLFSETTDPEVDFTTRAIYSPRKDSWLVNIGNTRKTCRLIVSEFLQRETFFKQSHARLCKPAVNKCPVNADENSKEKCNRYTSYVYEKSQLNGKIKTIYKNFHCAMCHNVAVERLTCHDTSDYVWHTDPRLHEKAWLPLLLDFNFNNDHDDQAETLNRECRLNNGQLWDPLLRSCLNLTCAQHFKRVNGKCVFQIINGNETVPPREDDCQRVTLTSDMFVVLDNASIYVNYSKKIYLADSYEKRHNLNGTLLEVLLCAEELPHIEFSRGQAFLSEITLGISVTCLILHLIAYGILPKLQNRPGKILMSLSASLVCGHFFFLIGSHLNQVFWLCYLHGVVAHFGYLSAFFWMSVMAFDIHGTFSVAKTRSNFGRHIFRKYSVFAWVTAFVIVLIALIVDNVIQHSLFRPKYGDVLCWINQKKALLIFFAAPVAVLLSSNILFFIITAISIHRISKQTKMVNAFSEKMRYVLYIKLSVVLGLTWIFGFMATLLNVSALWYPFIVLNGLQGAFIFFAFTVKRKVIHMLIVKLKLRSYTYQMKGKEKGEKLTMYSSLSNLTTLQTSLTSSVVPALTGNSEMLKAVRRIHSVPNIQQCGAVKDDVDNFHPGPSQQKVQKDI